MSEWGWFAIFLAGVAVMVTATLSLRRPGDKESRQYRRDMYRQQQASWHAQEEAWSRPAPDAKELAAAINPPPKPHIRLAREDEVQALRL